MPLHIDRSAEGELLILRYSSYQMNVSSPEKPAVVQIIAGELSLSHALGLRITIDDQPDNLIDPTVNLGRILDLIIQFANGLITHRGHQNDLAVQSFDQFLVQGTSVGIVR